MKIKKVIMPLPSRDFDPTEVSISWKVIREAGYQVEFATVDGSRGYPDPLMITGEGLDPWGWIPVLKKLKLLGLLLRADKFAQSAYRELEQDANFLSPVCYDALKVDHYDGLILPGGHAPRMKQYLEDKTLQAFVADFFDTLDAAGDHKPVGAICHGAVLAARSISKNTNKSVLYGKKTTALTWALERSAWHLTKFFARFWDPTYYRTYIESGSESSGYWSVEMEIKRALKSGDDFLDVPADCKHYRLKTSGMARDRVGDNRCAWVVRDGNYISARWPGDAHTFAKEFSSLL